MAGNRKNDSSKTGIGVGSSSILTVFVVLCLTTFATLSMVSARADLRLSTRAADLVTAYYSADAQAQRLMADLKLIAGTSGASGFAQKAADLEGVTSVVNQIVYFTFEVDENRTLTGEVDIKPAFAGSNINVLSYRLIVSDEGSFEEQSMNLMEWSMPRLLR